MDNINFLNKEQKQAVMLYNKNTLVLAGAGSGKTRVLTQRIVYLCKKKNVLPEKILAVTFTNKAAKEMRDKIKKYLDFSNKIWIGTFHSIAYKILIRNNEKFYFDHNFKLINQNNQLNIIKKIIKKLNLDQNYYSSTNIQRFINYKKHELNDVYCPGGNTFSDKKNEIFKLYIDYLKNNNSLDFADLLIYLYKLFRLDKKIRFFYQNLFKYIFIDEFQDINDIQYKWLSCLKGKEYFHGCR